MSDRPNNMVAGPPPRAVAAPATARLSHIPLKQCTTLEQAFSSVELKDRISQALPKHMSPDRMLRTFVQAVQKAPLLAKADLRTFIGACLTLSAVGLEPNGPLGHAYLIPFRRRKYNPETRARDIEEVEVQLILGYQGLLDLAYRSPLVTSIQAHVVFQGDDFDFSYGTDPHLTHRPKGGQARGAPPVAAYTAAKLRDGFSFEVLDWSDVLRIRNGSQAYQQALKAKEEAESKGWRTPATFTEAPWVKHEIAMARKTAFRSGSKWLPRSIELASVVAIDEAQERRRGVNWGQVLDANDGDYLAAATVAAEQPDDEPQPTEAGSAGASFGVRPQPVQQAQQAEPVRDPAPASPFGDGDGYDEEGPGPDPQPDQRQAAPEPAKPAPAPRQQRAPHAAPPPAEEPAFTVFDAYGEPVQGVPPLTSPTDFATAYAKAWGACHTIAETEALAEHNGEALAWARASAKAKKVIDGLEPPVEQAEPLDESGSGDPVDNLPADTSPKVAEPAPKDEDGEWATWMCEQAEKASRADVDGFIQNGAIRKRMARLKTERPDLHKRVEAAFQARLSRKD